MKKLRFIIALALLLVACGTNAKEQEEKQYETEIVRVDLNYKTIEEDDANLPEGEKKVTTKGKNGYKKEVYRIYEDGTRKFMNDWTYEDAVHEVVKVGTKKDEADIDNESAHQTDNNTSSQNNGNSNNGYTPPQTGGGGSGSNNTGGGSTGGGGSNTGGNGGGSTTPPITDPKPPVNVCNVYEGNDGNGWWNSYDEANAWADSQIFNEGSQWYMYAYAIGSSEKGCGWFIYFY